MRLPARLPRYGFMLLLLGVAAFAIYGELQRLSGDKSQQGDGHKVAIEQFYLKNGMEVVLIPNHRVPAVSHMLWLRVGSADDPLGASGVAHFLEHMMFKATKSRATGDYSKQVELMGGQTNAFTSYDFTGYYVNVAKQHLPKVMAMEADRFANLTPAANEFITERDVVIEERQTRIDNQPAAIFSEMMNSTFYQHHPYRIPIIGWMHEIETLDEQTAMTFYRQHYHAGNLVLVVSGDMSRAELEPLAEHYYGSLPARSKSERRWVKEPPAHGARHVYYSHPQLHQPRWLRYYPAPQWRNSNNKQAMALSLLAHWLGEGKSSLLYQSLVLEQKLASGVAASYSGLSRGPEIFSISVTPLPGVSFAQIDAAVEAAMAQAKASQPNASQLKRMQTQAVAAAIFARDGLQPMANFIGQLRMLDLPVELLHRWPELVKSVSAEEISTQAKAVLVKEKSVTGYLSPQTEEGKAP